MEKLNKKDLPSEDYDIIVVGSGLAGLYAALYASSAFRVGLLTKTTLEESCSFWAQGGIAAVMDPEDSILFHMEDTLKSGQGLCDVRAVSVLVNEGPDRVKDLIELGMKFDMEESGLLELGLEGGHSRRRVLHAGGSATGRLMVEFLIEAVTSNPNITVLENTSIIELLSDGESCYGALAIDESTNEHLIFTARSTILAMGGAASLYSRTTNPPSATGDGIAIAFNAGAEVRDMEFMQFHPTALYIEGGESFLITEAVRGEGAYLLNAAGHRFMPDYDKRGELATRDVVSRAIYDELGKANAKCVYLDLRHLDAEFIKRRFANIVLKCSDYGIDITRDLIPVAPAAHYTIGGVRSGLSAETNIQGLFVCGEVASTGIHGANRLANNSLLECIVFAKRAVDGAKRTSVSTNDPHRLISTDITPGEFYPEGDKEAFLAVKLNLSKLMDEKAGIVRSASGLSKAIAEIERVSMSCTKLRGYFKHKIKNIIEASSLICRSALLRTETRGAHIREEYPEQYPRWKAHIVLHKGREPYIEKC